LLMTPVPVIAQTRVPSVTGDGDDMFCFCSRWLPPPRGRCHNTLPLSRSTHHKCNVTASCDRRSSATFRKTRDPQMAGVDPENAGIASFHTMFSFCDQRNGRFVSWLTPLPDGPRHAGQFSTAVVARGARSMSNVECQTSNCGGMTNVKMTKVAQNVF